MTIQYSSVGTVGGVPASERHLEEGGVMNAVKVYPFFLGVHATAMLAFGLTGLFAPTTAAALVGVPSDIDPSAMRYLFVMTSELFLITASIDVLAIFLVSRRQRAGALIGIVFGCWWVIGGVNSVVFFGTGMLSIGSVLMGVALLAVGWLVARHLRADPGTA